MIASIAGAGGAGLLHALSFRAAGIPVGHVFDPDVDRAVALAALVGACVHPTLDSLADAGSEVVSICSPPPRHVDQAERCSAGARVVFVEKPVAISSAGLARLELVPRCVPIVQWRVGRGLRSVRRALREGLLGDAPTVSVDMALHRGPEYFAGARRGRDVWGCGALLSVGIHALDAVAFALGREIAGASCFVDTEDRSSVERAAVVVLRFTGGALSTLRITFDASAQDGDVTRFVFCGNGVTATITGSEADPTASAAEWSTADERVQERLCVLEGASSADGADLAHGSPPLLVPYLGEATRALQAGFAPGEHEALPTVRAVARAHRVVLDAYEAPELARSSSSGASPVGSCTTRASAPAASSAAMTSVLPPSVHTGSRQARTA